MSPHLVIFSFNPTLDVNLIISITVISKPVKARTTSFSLFSVYRAFAAGECEPDWFLWKELWLSMFFVVFYY